MAFVGPVEKREYKTAHVYKYTDVQSGDIEYTFWADKYEEDLFYGRKTVQEIVVEDFCVEDHI